MPYGLRRVAITATFVYGLTTVAQVGFLSKLPAIGASQKYGGFMIQLSLRYAWVKRGYRMEFTRLTSNWTALLDEFVYGSDTYTSEVRAKYADNQD